MANLPSTPPARTAFLDVKTGLVTRDWYLWFQSIANFIVSTNEFQAANASQFPGTTVTNQIDAAIASFAGIQGLVVIPANLGPGLPTSIPSNITIFDFRNGFAIYGGVSGGTLAAAIKLFSSASFDDDYLQLSQDSTFGGFFRRGHTNTPTYISAVPNGTIADGSARAIFRAYGTDIVSDPVNFESVDFESERAPASVPGGPLTVYYFTKTRIGGTGLHRPVLAQVGGINLMYMDPIIGCIVTCPNSVDSLGASLDFITGGGGRGDLIIGRNGRALRSVNSTGSFTIPLVSASGLDEVVIGASTTNARISGKVSNYGGIATAGQGLSTVYGATFLKTESAADTNVLTFTPPASGGQYRINFSMSVSAQSAATLGWTATWRDSNGTAQGPTNLSLFTSGTAAPALTVTAATNGAYYGTAIVDIDNSATAIVVKLTFTGTSFTAKASASIERLQ